MIIVAETRLKALHKYVKTDLIVKGVNPGETTKALHKYVKTDLIVKGVNPGETTTIITNTIIVAETRLKA